jgi:hypothetical protein
MMRKQRGVTMIGWIFLLVPVAIVLYAGMRVGPEYLNYYKVTQALKETAVKLKSDEALNAQTIRAAVEKRFDTGYIDIPKPEDIAITKADKGWQMKTDYETTVPLFGNLYLLMTFKQAVVIN